MKMMCYDCEHFDQISGWCALTEETHDAYDPPCAAFLPWGVEEPWEVAGA